MLYYNTKSGGSFGRDPYWLTSGLEVNDTILWSQPEIVLYDRSYHGGTSAGGYPDILFPNFDGDLDDLPDDPPIDDVRIIASQKGMPSKVSIVFLSKIEPNLLQGLYVVFEREVRDFQSHYCSLQHVLCCCHRSHRHEFSLIFLLIRNENT